MVPHGSQRGAQSAPKCTKTSSWATSWNTRCSQPITREEGPVAEQGASGIDIGIGIGPASTSNIDSLAIALGMEIGAMGMGK